MIEREAVNGFKESMLILFDHHLEQWNCVAAAQHG
jgi:hypothetical protein